MRSSSIYLSTFFVFIFAFTVSPLYAAYLYIDPSETELFRGDSVIATIRIDTDENECINVVDAVLSYDDGIRAVDVSRGESILNLWVEDPKIDETDRTVSFAGGITGGYCGRAIGDPGLSNVIASIVFQSPGFAIGGDATEVPQVKFLDTTRVLLNDGLGTEATLRTSGSTVVLNANPGVTQTDSWRTVVSDDNQAPSDFSVTLSKIETAFSNQYFITWTTIDKQTGIDHYEVMEEPLEDLYAFTWGRADAPWTRAESPFVLKDQTLNSTIRVKAIDKAGNETISILLPDEALRSLSHNRLITYSIVVAVALLVLVSLGVGLLYRRRQIMRSYEFE